MYDKPKTNNTNFLGRNVIVTHNINKESKCANPIVDTSENINIPTP